MKPPAFRYVRAASSDEAVDHLVRAGADAALLAGGQSLMPMLNLRLSAPDMLVDINAAEDLQSAELLDDGTLRVGAGVVHSAVEDGLIPDATNGLLAHVAAGIGYRAIRNRGTVGGSLAHADPSGEWPLIMSAVGAAVTIKSPTGSRRLPVRELFVGYYTTVLAENELIVDVRVPPMRPTNRWSYRKFARKVGEFAQSICVAILDVHEGEITGADVWLGAAADVPLRLTTVEAALVGRPVESASDDIRDAVIEDLPESSGVGAGSAEERYLQHLRAVTVCRTLDQELSRR